MTVGMGEHPRGISASFREGIRNDINHLYVIFIAPFSPLAGPQRI